MLLLPSTSRAWDFTLGGQELNLSLTNTFGYTYHLDNGDLYQDDDKYHQVLNSLDASLSYQDFRLGGRFDLHLFANTPYDQHCGGPNEPSFCADREARYVNTFAAERLYLIVARPEFDLTMGDFYVSFGKGLALNIVKIDELGQDPTIRGGKFVLHQWDLQATFVAGQINVLDLDEATGWEAPWPAEPILGGRLEYRFFDTLVAGTHGVYVISDEPSIAGTDEERTDHNMVVGAGLELPSLWEGRLSLAGEFDLQRTIRRGQVIRGPGNEGEEMGGLAGYGSATLGLGDWTLLAEFKYYDDFVLRGPSIPTEQYQLLYHQSPTLERVTATIADNTKVSGGRLRLDYNLGQLGPLELLLFANYGYFKNWAKEEHRIHDPYGGLELQWQEGEGHLTLQSGLRREHNEDRDEIYRRDIHLEIEVEQSVAAHHSLKLSAVLLLRQYNDGYDFEEWKELEAMLGYKWSPHLALAITFERQEEPKFVAGREEKDLLLGPANFLGGSAQYFITPSTYLTLRLGQNRPGLKCINGVCRNYPAFAGVQLLMVGRL